MSVVLNIFTFILVLVSLFLVLVILMQRAKSDGGVGAALGGGVTEAAFGAESGNVLSKATTVSAVIFFVLGFLLFLGHLYVRNSARADAALALPDAAVTETLPADMLPSVEGAEVPAATTDATSPAATESAPAATEQPAETPAPGGS